MVRAAGVLVGQQAVAATSDVNGTGMPPRGWNGIDRTRGPFGVTSTTDAPGYFLS